MCLGKFQEHSSDNVGTSAPDERVQVFLAGGHCRGCDEAAGLGTAA